MGRRLAVSRMTETVQVGRFEDGVDASGAPTRVLVMERYAGVGRVKYPTMAVSDRDEPSQVFGVQDVALSVPTDSPELVEGDEVLVSASTADGGLVGRTYRVAGSAQAGQTTAHRYPVKEL